MCVQIHTHTERERVEGLNSKHRKRRRGTTERVVEEAIVTAERP